MTDYKKRLTTAVATVAVLANALMPLANADTNLTISGNGENSSSAVSVNNTSTTNVTQNNTANFENNVNGTANTGGNSAVSNTGGSVSVTTGDASVDNTVTNSANQNFANVSCACDQGDTLVKIAGNGEGSSNGVELSNSTNVTVNQTNKADFDNNVWGTAKTGYNHADGNTGGSVSITTGDASVSNDVSNWANGNSAVVGGDGSGGSMSLMILGNGEDSSNAISVDADNSVKLNQKNNADFDNHVGGTAKTGGNSAVSNTGGDIDITTGDASVDNTVDNMANFNWADLNCGCTTGDLNATISGNGEDSSNGIEVNLDSTQKVTQKNKADFDNDVWGTAKTGYNHADGNTGDVMGSDPSVTTGDASVTSDVNNTANLNGLGGDMPDWPTWDFGGVHVTINFSLSALLSALGL